MTDDAALLRRYLSEQSEDAFAALVQRHLPLVYNAALRQLAGATHRAEDVTQTVFVDLARKAATLSGRSHLGGWLYLSTHFAAAKLKRDEQRREIREQTAHAMNEEAFSGAGEVQWEQLRPVLDDAMVALNERDREVILLRFFENCRFGELGGKLGLSEDAARMRVDRALEKLRELLAKRGIGSTSAAIGGLLANQTMVAAPPALAATVSSTAFTAAGVAGGSAFALLHFMSTSKIMVGTASVVVALLLATSMRDLMASRAVESRLVERRHDYETLLATRLDLEKQSQALEVEVAGLKKSVDERRVTDAPVVAPETKPAEGWDPVAGGAAFLQRHPAVREALLAQKNALVDSQWGTLYSAMGWSEEQRAEFRRLMRSTMTSFPGTLPGPMILSVEPALMPQEKMAGLNALLGDEGMKKMVNFGAKEPARNLALRLATGLGFSAEPLTPPQAEALVNVIPFVSPDGRKAKEVNWDELIPVAQGILTPGQLTALERVKALEMALKRPSSGGK